MLLPRSIRWRLTGWYTLMLAGLLLLFSLGTALAVYRLLIENFDEVMDSQASLIVKTIDVRNGDLMLNNDSLRPGRANDEHLLRIYRADGRLLYNDNPDEDADVLRGAVPNALNGQRIRLEFPGRRGTMRVLTVPILDGQKVAGVLQLGLSLEDVGETMRALIKALLVIAPAIVLLAGIVGFFLASRALGPIDRITRAAQQISADNFNRRLDLRGPDDEVGRLARTFDAMLTRLQLAFEQQRRFTADASHELRSPLTAIIGQIDVAVAQPRPAERYHDTLLNVREQAQRLARLTNDMLFLARSDAEPHPFTKEPLDLSQLLPAILAQLEPLAQARQQELSAEVLTPLLIEGNEDDLIRLFLNLIDNAIRYSPAGGSIRVAASAPAGTPGTIRVQVRDSGPGIAPEHIPHLFDRFFRVDRGRNRATGGTGLGLSIAQTIAQAHGGQLQVESAVGKGSTFTVILPCAAPPPPYQLPAQ
ncbi:hypothetical protein SE17_10560 [Kouleothrix aurantiaca]|uniref:histidine kinase n=1 Tax=Kouleothrix aurantiaca TaxID=186479 RepID=A0A0P9F9G3_9CHLR|nr:hypothetical protein SE17_10560 [Kouleothrix aurantiaca]